VREADGCFIGGRNEAETRDASRRAKALAAKLGKPIRTYCMMTVITGATDAQAEAKAQKYRDGLDEGAVLGMLESYGVPLSGEGGNAMTARAQGAFMTQTAVGSPATCAAKIEKFLRDCDIDGLMFVYDDYIQGLRVPAAKSCPAT
jgi:pyrimidine oxygenase